MSVAEKYNITKDTTRAEYLLIYKYKGLQWREIPFICHQCGKEYFRKKATIDRLPKYCSLPCRKLADGLLPRKTFSETVDIARVRSLIDDFKSVPQLADIFKVTPPTMRKICHEVLTKEEREKLKKNSNKNRRRGIAEEYDRRRELGFTRYG